MRARSPLAALIVAGLAAVTACSGSSTPSLKATTSATTTAGDTTTTGSGAGGGPGATTTLDTTTTVPATTTTEAPTTTTTVVLDAKGVLAATRSSVAYLSTPVATGSGILIAGGYIVTNAHVVDPYDRATVQFPGSSEIADVKVVGVDIFADIAVLGPVTTSGKPLEFGDPSTLDGGEELYLVGYPGDNATNPEPTISRGILSNRREVPNFGQHYLQTDAAIAHGQSGGALLDKFGHVVGVSGLSIADNKFALALAAPDVQTAIDAIKAGHGSAYTTLPNSVSDTTASIPLASPDEMRFLYFPPSSDDRTLALQIPTTARWEIDTVAGDLVTIDPAQMTAIFGNKPASSVLPPGATVAKSSGKGAWSVTLPKGPGAVLLIGTSIAAGATVAVTSSEPFALLPETDQNAPIKVGDVVSGIIDTYEVSDSFVLDMRAGQTVRITVSSPQGDMDYSVVAPGEKLADVPLVTDGGGGLYGVDAQGTYTAKKAGPVTIVVTDNDDVATGYKLTIG